MSSKEAEEKTFAGSLGFFEAGRKRDIKMFSTPFLRIWQTEIQNIYSDDAGEETFGRSYLFWRPAGRPTSASTPRFSLEDRDQY